MRKFFKVAKNEESVDNWIICWTGQSVDGNHWNVTTNQVHASELAKYSKGAQGDAELIVELLNRHYSGELAALEDRDKIASNLLTDCRDYLESVIKPVNGVGCENEIGLVDSIDAYFELKG